LTDNATLNRGHFRCDVIDLLNTGGFLIQVVLIELLVFIITFSNFYTAILKQRCYGTLFTLSSGSSIFFAVDWFSSNFRRLMKMVVLRVYNGRDRMVVGFTTNNYLCNQCPSPLMLWVRILIRARCTILWDKVCEWLATDQWFSLGPPPIKLTATI
jgi:hypothetical protein